MVPSSLSLPGSSSLLLSLPASLPKSLQQGFACKPEEQEPEGRQIKGVEEEGGEGLKEGMKI